MSKQTLYILVGTVLVILLGLMGYFYYAKEIYTPISGDTQNPEIAREDKLNTLDNFTQEGKNAFELQAQLKANEVLQFSEPLAANFSKVVEAPLQIKMYEAQGNVIWAESEESSVIRLEDVSMINGPELHVFLAKGMDLKNAVDLGEIKSTEGSANYAFDKSYTREEYNTVLVASKFFGIVYYYANLK
ncbi:MAG: hypothetical protein R3B92_00375 [Patescibacteria group bacterium]|uniref:DM13 domain-containing protein n=1 Tax=candidate division WWE3 bacterium TaxID=2053526 RepID=A0A955EEF4_UNCKA|nr:hypothetical protein [candidate division WWE3 bacterium]